MPAIGHLPETLGDRCIVIRMERKKPGQECEKLRTLDGGNLRRKCARFVMDHAEAIAQGRPMMPEELNDRAADVWEPLFVLAEIAGGAWPDKARAASIRLTDGPQEKGPGTVLIREILNCFEAAKTDRLFSWSLVVWLKQVENAPWAGRRISERWLARQLKPYGVRPRTIWFMELSAKGYMREDFGEGLIGAK